MLAPWGRFAYHKATLCNLTNVLEELSCNTASALQKLQLSLDSLASVVLDNQITFNYWLVEQGGVCALANISCCIWINTSSKVELEIKKKNSYRPLGFTISTIPPSMKFGITLKVIYHHLIPLVGHPKNRKHSSIWTTILYDTIKYLIKHLIAIQNTFCLFPEVPLFLLLRSQLTMKTEASVSTAPTPCL